MRDYTAPDHPVIRELVETGEYKPRHLAEGSYILRSVDDFGIGDLEEACGLCGERAELTCGLCESCREETEKRFRELMLSEFSESQRMWLDMRFEGMFFED